MPVAWRIDVRYKPERGREKWLPSIPMTYTDAKREAIRLGALGYRVRLVNLMDESKARPFGLGARVWCENSPSRRCSCDGPDRCPRRARLAGDNA
jgi:hypothetical protein